jgi:hypothetical protein
VLPPLGLPRGAVSVIQKRGEIGIAPDVNAAAVAAVAAVGTAFGFVLESGEGAGTGPAGTPGDPDYGAIDEHQFPGDHPSRTVRQSSFTFFH